MIFQHDFKIPALTLEEYPLIEEIKLVKGLIYKVELLFPPGCAGLAKVAIKDNLHQLWPSRQATWFYSDNETISFDETFELNFEPVQLKIVGYNTDDVWDHTILIRLGIVDKDIYIARYLPTLAYEMERKRVKEEKKEEERSLIIQPFLPFRTNT